MKRNKLMDKNAGFTLIEMIGVIAVIAILAAVIAPKVFSVIEDSKATRFTGEIGTYRNAVIAWYKDIGTLQSLVAAGTLNDTDDAFHAVLIASNGTSGVWGRWSGPYIDTVANISIGTALTIETNPGTSGIGAPSASNATSFDLNDDAKNDMTSKQVVALKLTGVSNGEFSKIDGAIDLGLTSATKETSGRIKYDSAGSVLYVYIASN